MGCPVQQLTHKALTDSYWEVSRSEGCYLKSQVLLICMGSPSSCTQALREEQESGLLHSYKWFSYLAVKFF